MPTAITSIKTLILNDVAQLLVDDSKSKLFILFVTTNNYHLLLTL
jgi:hypothetical protein